MLRQIAIDLLKGKLPAAAAEDLAQARLRTCASCPEFAAVARQCRLCGCFMDVKAKLLAAECPQGRW